MKIENAQYGTTPNADGIEENHCVNCRIDGLDWSVPLDPNNRHYAEILRQVQEGTLTIQDAE